MAVAIHPTFGKRRVTASRSTTRFRLLAGVPLAVGVLLSFLGCVWDVQWHSDVGPDTFFTAPHLVLYSGVAIAGLSCLLVVLLTTRQIKRGDTAAAEDTVGVLRGAFRAPAGFVVGGIGATFFLLYGLVDQWWHGVYGFDVTLVSPPHVGLILSVLVTMVGSLIAFAGETRRAVARGQAWSAAAVGLAASTAILVAFVTPTAMAVASDLWPFSGRVDSGGVVIAFLYPATLLGVASVLRRPGAATLTALFFALLRLLTWEAAPWVIREYAAAVGLFLRDNTSGVPVVPGLMPTYLLLAAVVVDVGLVVARRRGWNARWVLPALGALAALLLRWLEPTLPAVAPGPELTIQLRERILAIIAAEARGTLLVVPFVGAVSAWLGWQLGIVLRLQGASAATSATDRPPRRGLVPAPEAS